MDNNIKLLQAELLRARISLDNAIAEIENLNTDFIALQEDVNKFDSRITAAQAAADAANQTANLAQQVANAAKTVADTAQQAADAAKTAADTAQQAADAAKTAADTAQQRADSAYKLADDGITLANEALNNVVQVKETADTALTEANTAKDAAGVAYKMATTAQTTANNAASAANAAQTTADTAKQTADRALAATSNVVTIFRKRGRVSTIHTAEEYQLLIISFIDDIASITVGDFYNRLSTQRLLLVGIHNATDLEVTYYPAIYRMNDYEYGDPALIIECESFTIPIRLSDNIDFERSDNDV